MRYVGSVIRTIAAVVDVDQSMEEGFDKELYGVDGWMGWWKWDCMVKDSLLKLMGERFF